MSVLQKKRLVEQALLCRFPCRQTAEAVMGMQKGRPKPPVASNNGSSPPKQAQLQQLKSAVKNGESIAASARSLEVKRLNKL